MQYLKASCSAPLHAKDSERLLSISIRRVLPQKRGSADLPLSTSISPKHRLLKDIATGESKEYGQGNHAERKTHRYDPEK